MHFLKNQGVQVFLVLVVGLGVIVYLNPPYTACTAQVELYHNNIKSMVKPFGQKLALCKERTELGGCLGIFEVLSKLELKATEVGSQCYAELAKDDMTKNWMSTGLELFVNVAWGSRAPASAAERNGWLELSHVAQFCRLKRTYINIYGQETWDSLAEGLLNALPGASELNQQIGRPELWLRTLMSNPCQNVI